LGWTLKVTSPVPFPEPCATSIHATDFDADQPQPAGAVTVKRPPPPPDGNACDVGLSTNVQATAVWRTVTAWFATVYVTLRAAPVFAATASVTTADPVPDAGDVIVSHGTAVVADHAQVGPSDNWIVCVDAADEVSIVSGVTVGVQLGSGGGIGPGPGPAGAAAAWLTTNCLSATVMMPTRSPASLPAN
jgi:hypothetical protein